MKSYKFRTQYHVKGVWYEKGAVAEFDAETAKSFDPLCVEEVKSPAVVGGPAHAPDSSTETQADSAETETVAITDTEVESANDTGAVQNESTKPIRRIRKK